MKKLSILFIVIIASVSYSFAQAFDKPIAGKQSHPEMSISKIEITTSETIFNIEVTNKRDNGGWFCADKSIYIKNTNGTEKYQLIQSEGIPTCPEQYDFTSKGEVLKFKLIFPKISENISFIDLIEDCNNACFYFTGIILNNQHNKNIVAFEKGFDLYQNQKFDESIALFQNVISNKTIVESQIYSLSYYYLITIYFNQNKSELVKEYYELLKKSNLEDKETIEKELIKNKIIQEKVAQ